MLKFVKFLEPIYFFVIFSYERMSGSSEDESWSDDDSIVTTMRTTAKIEDNVNR